MTDRVIAFSGARVLRETLDQDFEWHCNVYIGDDLAIHTTALGGSTDFFDWFWHIALDQNKAFGPPRPHGDWDSTRLADTHAWGLYARRDDRIHHDLEGGQYPV